MTATGSSSGPGVEVHYQPVVDLRTGRVGGVEALARWRAPDGALLGPISFIDAAERTDRIVELGQVVRRRAISQVADWARRCERELDLHVNVSPHEFDDRLVPGLLETLESAALAPSALVLEITESRPFADAPRAATIVQLVREHGIRIALDDFGVGWSSVDRLHALDVDMVKIDRSFLATSVETPRSLTSAIVSYARRRGLDVVAEGVEQPEDVARLLTMGCRRAQGYALGRPEDPETLTARLVRTTALPVSATDLVAR